MRSPTVRTALASPTALNSYQALEECLPRFDTAGVVLMESIKKCGAVKLSGRR